MKKKLFVFLLLFFVLFLSGCEIVNQLMCEHDYVVLEEKEATCKEAGFIKSECTKCQNIKNETISKLSHEFTEWNIIKEATEKEDGLKQRTCLLCGELEEVILYSDSYVDMDIIRFVYEEDKQYIVNNYEDLDILFNACLLNLVPQMKCIVNYEIIDFNKLLNDLVNNSRIPLTFEISASLKEDELVVDFTYENIASSTTQNYKYFQYTSCNYTTPISSRLKDYDEFKINNSKYSYKVSTSEQLCYVLERKVKPICEEGSIASQLYNKMKEVLIEIIDDKMTNVEKVKAIYDYIIMNVTYDDELLRLASSNSNVKQYNGFYLEGVFLDKKAVCEGISKAITCLCNIEGIPCVMVEGYQTNNKGGLGHAWNKVCIDDIWYILDATSGGTIVNDVFEILSYQYFLIDEKTMNKKYTATTYKELVCNVNYDYYKNYSYNYENKTNDYLIESQEELNQIIKYYNSNNKKNNTIEFKVLFDFGTSISDEIQKAYNAVNITGQFSYIENQSIIVLVK